MSAPTTPAEVLDKAADVLEAAGWCRRSYVDAHGRHCALGAIYTAAPDAVVIDGMGAQLPKDGATQEAVAALAREVSPDHGSLPHVAVFEWNDSQRDRRKVVRTLRRAARNYRPKEEA